MVIERDLRDQLLQAATETPVVTILGPRQSGKTTLAQLTFPEHTYYNLEDHSSRRLASEDPKEFLNKFPSSSGIIIDEIQNEPNLLSYIQVLSDQRKQNGFYVLTRSQNIALSEKITQSLAGRVSELILLPLSIHELIRSELLPNTIDEYVFQGSYPRYYTQKSDTNRFYRNYINTYVKRDVRQIKNITNLALFQDFLQACASRTGQSLNLSSLSEDLGIAQNTVKSWLSVLEASFIIFRIKPYYRKYSRRLVRAPKLYFFDTGLVCSLLGIQNSEELKHSYLRGSLIETCIMADLYKQFCNADKDPVNLYYWRTQSGHEVDVIINRHPQPKAIEIKAGTTIAPDYFTGLTRWNKITSTDISSNYVVYAGLDTQSWPQAEVISWKESGTLISDILAR